MKMWKYVLKRVVLMFFTLFIITAICFVMIRLLPNNPADGLTLDQKKAVLDRMDALGYNEPLITQFGIYLKNIFTNWDWGTSWYIKYMEPAENLLLNRLLPTVLVNVYSLVFSMPLGIALGMILLVLSLIVNIVISLLQRRLSR